MSSVVNKMRHMFNESSPVRIVTTSFLLIILAGTTLLIMPVSSAANTFSNPVDALFTATSATCITGLTVYDTLTHWSIFGQIVILCLIQIGGLGIITFFSFFTMRFKRKLGIRDLNLVKESTSTNSTQGIRTLLNTIIKVTFVCELAGACILMTRFCPEFGTRGIYISIFLAISAYCNAGFDILGPEKASISTYNDDPVISLTITALIIMGGIGFIVYADIVHSHKTKRPLMTHSKVVLIGTAVLIITGTLIFLAFEWNNTLADMGFFEKLNASYMQSVFARTAGFYSVDLGQAHSYTKFVLMVYMFIGAAPGSTGGGVKISSIVVVISTILCVLRGREDTIINKRKVSHHAVYKALTIIVSGLFVIICTFIIIILSQGDSNVASIDAAFEAVSAFGTVGTTCGITSDLTVVSKIAVSITMFIGRVGPISLFLAITKKKGTIGTNEILPEAKIIAG